jgi:hypothetical protein
MSKSVKVTARRSTSSAEGALAIWIAGEAGLDWVEMVWPFSPVEREKMT